MIDLNQKVITKWNSFTKSYYESKGYEFTKLNDEFEVKAVDLKQNSLVEVEAKCDVCKRNKILPYKDYNKTVNKNGFYICKSCITKKRNDDIYSKEELFQRFIDFCERNDYEQVSTIDDYENAKTELYYICKHHGLKKITLDSITDDNVGCRECSYEVISKKLKKDLDQINEIVAQKGGEWLNPEEYEGVKERNLKIRCNVCKQPFITSLASYQNSGGACLDCGHIKTAHGLSFTVDYLNQLYNSGDRIILNNPEDYIKNNVRNLSFNCEVCGNPFITSKVNYDYGYTRCEKCSCYQTGGELEVENVLKKYNINFIFQHRFNDCRDQKPLPFDFYLPDFNCNVEFDGEQHFRPVFGQESFERTQKHDKMKNEYCEEHGIKLIRIPYTEINHIDEILRNELNLQVDN